MVSFNISVDFELAWGDLARAAVDEHFYRRILGGLQQASRVAALLGERGIPSTWGVVGACCFDSIAELREAAPAVFALQAQKLQTLAERRSDSAQALFCRKQLESLARTPLIELGSHGFMHLVPTGLPAAVLREDVLASVTALRSLPGAQVVSFIPPQNYDWPPEAFRATGIRYVRHSPRVFGYSYSDPRLPAKLSRLWNDLVRPAWYTDASRGASRLLFLRHDRGAAIWEGQLRLLRRILSRGSGSVFCFTHPHNLDTPAMVDRFAQFCDLIAELQARGHLSFTRFARELATAEAA